MHDELKEKLQQLEESYDGKAFWGIINRVKKDKIKDDELLKLIENISQKRFREKVSFTVGVSAGNLLAIAITVAPIVLAFQPGGDWSVYFIAFVLMATLHPLSHYITGTLLDIKFTHYYLNGPARIEPTLRIDYFSYLKASGKKRALMHASGVIGTVMAPLFAAVIALTKGTNGVVFNLLIFFLILIIFEFLTSTKTGDLMRARREYGYK